MRPIGRLRARDAAAPSIGNKVFARRASREQSYARTASERPSARAQRTLRRTCAHSNNHNRVWSVSTLALSVARLQTSLQFSGHCVAVWLRVCVCS